MAPQKRRSVKAAAQLAADTLKAEQSGKTSFALGEGSSRHETALAELFNKTLVSGLEQSVQNAEQNGFDGRPTPHQLHERQQTGHSSTRSEAAPAVADREQETQGALGA